MARTLTYYGPQYVSDVATPEYKIVFGTPPYHLESVEGLGAPDLNVISQNLPMQHGAQFSRSQYGPRLITIEGKLTGTITAQNTNKATISKACAHNNIAVHDTWMEDFWRLKATDSGIDTVAEFIDFLFNINAMGVLKYTSDGITPTKRINAVPYTGPVFKNKDGRQPYQSFQITFFCPSPFWEDDEYTLAINTTDDATTVDFEILGDVPPRMALHVEPTETTVSNNLELTITGKQNYTQGVASPSYVPTMLDMKSTAALVDGDLAYMSLMPGEKQMYIDRSANKIAVACGVSAPCLAYSVDGKNWVAATTVVGTQWIGCAWSPKLNLFCIVGTATPYFAYSVDGKNWVAATTVVGTQWVGIAWSPSLNLFVACGYTSPYFAYSVDGKNWVAATTVVGTQWNDVEWSPSLGLFAACGDTSPYFAYSVDGKNWVAATTVVGIALSEVVWSPSLGLFAACSYNSPYFMYSVDGKNWVAATTVVGIHWRSIAWSPSLNLFVAGSEATPYFAYSVDGKNWVAATTVVGTVWLGIAWSASLGLFIAGGTTSPYLAYSIDGKNWVAATTVVGTVWSGVSSFPDVNGEIDTNSKLTRFKALDMPPGDYRAVMLADQDMKWQLYYRKAWLGI